MAGLSFLDDVICELVALVYVLTAGHAQSAPERRQIGPRRSTVASASTGAANVTTRVLARRTASRNDSPAASRPLADASAYPKPSEASQRPICGPAAGS
ncbi:hypothetical protein [Paraburkholderia diazotrophica]|uniref:hypothetical protein n=1 Tax=Paraburkholderia diazotrophica TaxID=667676 RepID=UPI000B81674D|nr:hypothetical protein [Paraburkholderia diazotrophica]